VAKNTGFYWLDTLEIYPHKDHFSCDLTFVPGGGGYVLEGCGAETFGFVGLETFDVVGLP